MENGWFHLTCLKCRTRITKLLSQIITESRLEIGPQLYPAVWKYEHFTNSLTFIVVSNKIWLNIAMQFNLIIYVCSSWWDLSINYFNNKIEIALSLFITGQWNASLRSERPCASVCACESYLMFSLSYLWQPSQPVNIDTHISAVPYYLECWMEFHLKLR